MFKMYFEHFGCRLGQRVASKLQNIFSDYHIVTANKNGIIRLFVCLFVCLFWGKQPPVGQALLIYGVSRSRTKKHHTR